MILDSESECPQVVFLSDALSTLEALAGNKLPRLMEKLQELAKTRRVVLQWVPAHCGIPGNETADELAKLGAREEQLDNPISFAEKKTLVKAAMRPQSTRDAYNPPRTMAASSDHATTNGSLSPQRPHVQEAEADPITNLSLWSGRPDSRTCLNDMPPTQTNQSLSAPNSMGADKTWKPRRHSSRRLT
ncbi:hypothetical protein V1264_016348 [Littorina saxatilis]|uniref:RNase H type-1 domain-containing protein n=1 Tax=Littorina saxatilis TaxID=31220 RepID=A0AAN9BS37_9CAEN